MRDHKHMPARIIGFIAIILLVSACHEERIYFPDEHSFAAFETVSGSISENSENTMKIPVYLASHPGATVELEFSFSQDSIDNPAIEGEDYILMNDGNSLRFEKGTGYDTIMIKTLNNEIRDRDKILRIVLMEHSEVEVGLNQEYFNYTLTISDDEHPLSSIIGNWEVLAKSIWGSNLDVNYQVIAKAHTDDETKLILQNILPEVPEEIEAELDLEAGIMYIYPDQPLGEMEFGPMKIIHGEIANNNIYFLSEPIEGNFDDQGNMLMDNWGALITGGQYKDYFYNFYYTTEWTKLEK